MSNAALIAELRPALVAFFLRRCRNEAEAEDLAQDVVVRALAHAHWTSEEHAKSYIFRIALNRWRDRGRRKVAHGVELEWTDERAHSVAEEISTERVLDAREDLRKLVEALEDMDERTRHVLIMCRLEQLKQAEIAERLGISISSVEKHLVKGLLHLARRMHRQP